MPRPPSFTIEEDAIIIATAGKSAAETNRRLTEAGYPARSPGSIKQRRHVLRTRVISADDSVTAMLEHRKQLHLELEALDKQRQVLLNQLSELAQKLKKKLDEVAREVQEEQTVRATQ